ncbi:MAG: hypothetical protein ABIR55_16345, partial [Burkholderiaceae bacterium]
MNHEYMGSTGAPPAAWQGPGDRKRIHPTAKVIIQRQLQLVLKVGRDLEALTRTPGLRLTLKLMRRPANAAGLADLQHFLEQGFDTFARMGQRRGSTDTFLRLIDQRETALLKALFAGNQI